MTTFVGAPWEEVPEEVVGVRWEEEGYKRGAA